jgi:RNA polymerase sigma factor (sigma-70 family)
MGQCQCEFRTVLLARWDADAVRGVVVVEVIARCKGVWVERRLIERSKTGDRDAYDVLVERYQGLAFRAAYLTLGDVDEAEDAVQEAFVKAYLNLGRFQPGAPFRPWLLRIVTNEALNSQRTSRRQASLQIRSEHAALGHHSPEGPEDAVVAVETRLALVDGLNRLPARDRALIAYRYFLDLSPSEIADIWDRPASTIRTQLSRALRKLREQLDLHGGIGSTESSGISRDES